MKVYYSWFAYTVVLIAGIVMTICSPVLIFLMFKIEIDIWTVIFCDMFFVFILISGIGFTMMAVRRLFINRAVLELCEEGVYINYGAFRFKRLFIPKEELIKLVRYNTYTYTTTSRARWDKGSFVFYLKNDDILKSLGKLTNFTKDMNFKTLGIRLNDCLVPWNIIDSVEYYFKTVYKIKFER